MLWSTYRGISNINSNQFYVILEHRNDQIGVSRQGRRSCLLQISTEGGSSYANSDGALVDRGRPRKVLTKISDLSDRSDTELA